MELDTDIVNVLTLPVVLTLILLLVAWEISLNIGWVAIHFGADIHDPIKMNRSDFLVPFNLQYCA